MAKRAQMGTRNYVSHFQRFPKSGKYGTIVQLWGSAISLDRHYLFG
jgi:hypothetical protein